MDAEINEAGLLVFSGREGLRDFRAWGVGLRAGGGRLLECSSNDPFSLKASCHHEVIMEAKVQVADKRCAGVEGRQGLVGWDLRFRASGLVFRALGDALGGGV